MYIYLKISFITMMKLALPINILSRKNKFVNGYLVKYETELAKFNSNGR